MLTRNITSARQYMFQKTAYTKESQYVMCEGSEWESHPQVHSKQSKRELFALTFAMSGRLAKKKERSVKGIFRKISVCFHYVKSLSEIP